MPSEFPPRPPRACFGRNELVDQIIDLAETLTPLALIGAGGIGKTSIALIVLHNDRIKQRFGDDRRFIRCDQFPASISNFLRRLSTVTGAGTENPKDLTALHPFLSSKEMLIVLDNAESILDPEGVDSQEIYDVVEELGRFDNICLCITSRISTIPPDYEILDIPTLSMEAACDAFYGIYKKAKRSDVVDKILGELDFHPLSITLLATVAHQNRWDANRLTKEWENHRTGVLQTNHKKSLAATIELSLSSPMFQELGPDARALLEVVAFFPQGINENNLDWLFPTIPNREDIFNKFCVLSLTYRSEDFATMLAPLRDYLRPKDPNLSPLLCLTKECYFDRLNVGEDPDTPQFVEGQWIFSEDVNVEHLLDVFTTIDVNSIRTWTVCDSFMEHLRWRKPRLIVPGLKIERLPDDHPCKLHSLFILALAYDSLANHSESKRLLTYTLELFRERGNNTMVARVLYQLANANLNANRYVEGIPQAKEASEILGRLNYTSDQMNSLQLLAFLLAKDGQADAAEEVVSHATNLSSDELSRQNLGEYHHTLGHVCLSRGDMEGAISRHEKAIEAATSLNLQADRATFLRCLVDLLLKEGRLRDAQVHLESLKLDAVNDPFSLGLARVIQVCVWRRQGRFEEAESAISRIATMYEQSGVPAEFREFCEGYLRDVEGKINDSDTSN